jgi:hypothetical protein
MPDASFRNEHCGGLNVWFALGRAGSADTSKFNPGMLVLERFKLQVDASGSLELDEYAYVRLGRRAFSRASRVHLFDSSCQTVSKSSRLLNPIRWTVERLRPTRPARSKAFRLRWSLNQDVPTITRSGHGK